MPAESLSPRVRRSQVERSTQTRTKLIEATIDFLVDLGWAGATSTEIARRAGLTLGSQQHHFPDASDLFVGVTAHITASFCREIERMITRRSGAVPRPHEAIDIIWSAYTDRRATAQQEIRLTPSADARMRGCGMRSVLSNPKLRAIERELAQQNSELRRSLFTDEDDAQVDVLIDLTVELVRGLALHRQFGANPKRITRSLEGWKQVVERTLHAIETGEDVPRPESVGKFAHVH